MANNLIFLEQFLGTLSNWTLYTGGGTVSIALQDYEQQMILNDTSASDNVSASRAFAEPIGKWILEYDINFASGQSGIMELLSAGGSVIATVDCGTTADTLSFSTDSIGASTAAFTHATYKQVVLAVDNQAKTIKAYMSNTGNYPGDYLVQIGSTAAYSGTTVASVRFRTSASATGSVYIGQVKAFTPDWFLIGDSITDGKLRWSDNPGSSYRHASTSLINTSPNNHLAKYLGGTSTVWVSDRAFGSSVSADIVSEIQSNVIDQYAKKVFVAIGTNDIKAGTALSTIESNISSIISTLQSGGITGSNIILGNVIPRTSYFNNFQESQRCALNIWLRAKANDAGIVYVDNDYVITDPANTSSIADINPAYLDSYSGNNAHLNSAGNEVFARSIFSAWAQKANNISGTNTLQGAFGTNVERLFPQGYYVSSGGRIVPGDLNGLGGMGAMRMFTPLQ